MKGRVGSIGTSLSSARSTSATSAPAVCGRWAASFASPRSKTRSSDAGSSGAACEGGVGGWAACCIACAVAGPPANGRVPVSSS